jgi:hypothetical protein
MYISVHTEKLRKKGWMDEGMDSGGVCMGKMPECQNLSPREFRIFYFMTRADPSNTT